MTTPAETDRRLGDLLRYGEVCEVDGARCRVRLDEGFETDWLDMPPLRAGSVRIWAPFTEGERVSLACPDGDFAAATIHASHNGEAFSPPADPTHTRIDWADGSWIGYDPGAGDFTILVIDGLVRIVAPGGIKFEGDVDVDGQLKVTGPAAFDQDVTVDGVSFLEHVHPETGALTKKPSK